jgi:opine dehydrogenase
VAPDQPTVAVIGAGNVGCALAADLVLRGVDVRLWNRSPARLEPIRRAGGITATGAVEGFAPLDRLTASLEEAVRGAGIVAVTVPTPALPSLAPALAEITTADQLIWLDPGHSGGALYVAAEMDRRTGRRGRRLCQLSTASHGCRMSGPTTAGVLHTPRATLAAFPGTAVAECLERIDALLPGRFTPAETVLELDLGNVNAVLHPPLMVCNAGWIEATAGNFPIYRDGAGPAVARLIEAIDAERIALADRLGVPTVTLGDFLRDAGYTTPAAAATGRVHDALQAAEPVASVKAPPTLDHRYLHEDVGWGLVPWLELARHCGGAAPTMEAVSAVAGALNGVDYRREGLTLERMGLAGVDPDGIVAYARRGNSRSSR